MTTTTKATTNTQDRQTAFNALLRQAEKGLSLGQEGYGLVYPLACAIVRGVLRKVIEKSGNGVMYALRGEVEHDIRLLENTEHLNDIATAYEYNADGVRVQVVKNKYAEQALKALERDTVGEGIDLVHVAYIALLEQYAEHGADNGAWLDKPYTKRVLDKRVVIRRDDSAALKEVETLPIKEVYRAVRAAIRNSASVQAASLKYTYIEELTEKEGEKAFRRLPKYSDLGAEDNHGVYTADSQTAADYYTLLDRLNLSARQVQIIELRMKGYGQRAIASYLGISPQGVQKHLTLIQAKAKGIGLAYADRA